MTAPTPSAGSADEPANPCETFEMGDGGIARSTGFGVGLTKRQHAAILLRDPSSGEEWLDDMIRRARLREVATAAMQGMLAQVTEETAPATWDCAPDLLADNAERCARALLSRLDGEVKP